MKKTISLLLLTLISFAGCGQKSESVSELLEGVWQDTEDANSYIAFENGQRKEMYAGVMDWSAEPYTLSGSCANEADKGNNVQPEENKYITCKESDMCWYIVKLDKENLVLSHVGRGNTLSYKRAKEADIQVVSNNGCEDFDTFLARYNSDFEFQKSRTIFPFINEFYEYEEVESEEHEIEFKENIITTETSKSEWTKMDFTWDPENATRDTDAFTQEIIADGNTTAIQFNGVENGINVRAVFICRNGEWFLQKMVDQSM